MIRLKEFKTGVLSAVLTLMAILMVQSTAMATSKTVTYTFNAVNNGGSSYTLNFTRSGDSFGYSTGAKTATISNIQSTSGFHVDLDDGLGLQVTVTDNSSVSFGYDNGMSGIWLNYPNKDQKANIAVNSNHYYVTHVKIANNIGEALTGQANPWMASIGALDQEVSMVPDGDTPSGYRTFNANVTAKNQIFAQLIVTYGDAPGIGVFEAAGANTYNIKNITDLRHLAEYVNNGGNPCSGLTFLQTQDINYSPTDAWNNTSSEEDNYTPIGTYANMFQGTYDGQNHTISGIRSYTDASGVEGLFGYIGKGGTVRGVNLANARITGKNYVGGIAGSIYLGTVEDCSVAADVCIHSAVISSYYHGGIVGVIQGTVQRCLSRATLTVADAADCKYYGAIVGYNNDHAVKDCIAIGATVPNISIGNYRGAIIGMQNINYNNDENQRNYYRACTVAGTENATGVGVGSDKNNSSPHDITENQGAQALYSLTLPSGVSLVRSALATLPGAGNKTYTTGADIAGTPYAYAGANLTLNYSGEVPEGNIVLYTYNDGTEHDITDNTFTMPASDVTVSISFFSGLVLYDNADNWSAINDHDGETVNVMLHGRTLYKNGKWNTLCLPFNLKVSDDIIENEESPLHGAIIRTFEPEIWHDRYGSDSPEYADGMHRSGQIDNGKLYLYFYRVMDGNIQWSTDIIAGEPMLVKWDGNGTDNIVNPVFKNVTINKDTYWMNLTTAEGRDDNAHEGNVTFKSTYSPITITSEDKSILFMGGNSTLYYPNGSGTTNIGAFRAYFQLNNGITAGNPDSEVKGFVLDFGEDAADGIGGIHNSQFIIHNENSGWYMLDGRKVEGKPSNGGIYIHNGRKEIIK